MRWYTGKTEGRIDTPLGSAYSFRRKHHWTAKAVRGIVYFYLRHWKWIFGFILAVVVAVQKWS